MTCVKCCSPLNEYRVAAIMQTKEVMKTLPIHQNCDMEKVVPMLCISCETENKRNKNRRRAKIMNMSIVKSVAIAVEGMMRARKNVSYLIGNHVIMPEHQKALLEIEKKLKTIQHEIDDMGDYYKKMRTEDLPEVIIEDEDEIKKIEQQKKNTINKDGSTTTDPTDEQDERDEA